MNRFVTLLKREYWEHRGGFLWAPTWTSGILTFIVVVALVAASWHTSGRFNGELHVGVPIKMLLNAVESPERMAQLAIGLNGMLVGLWLLIQAITFFVLAFYLIGALYDDRRDRSILFWKSMPVTDTQTVLSKVVVAALGAPLLAWLITVALQLSILTVLSLFVLLHGGNPLQLIWGPAEPMSVALRTLAIVPVNAIWALPTIGWLLLASSFARSKPFLWAIALPVAVGLAINTFDLFEALRIPDTWYWSQIASRILLSLVPISWGLIDNAGEAAQLFNTTGPATLVAWKAIASLFTTVQLWAGAAAGAAMIAAAIHFRRTRELAD